MQAASAMSGGEEPLTPGMPGGPDGARPARIGKYEVRSEVGKGTLVKLFRASDRDTGRSVILKVLTGSRDRRLVELFRRVVGTAARLRHRNLITIYELGEHAGLPFAAMQDLEGRELRASMGRHSPLTLLQKISIMEQVAEGLQTAHHGGLTYVGVRPSGISLTDEGSAVIHDFSIVRLIGEEQDEDVSYAAPEELKAGALPDQLCDVFSFGAMLYELLAGAHPFRAAVPIPLRKVAPDCPEDLERLVHRAFQLERDRRYQSMDEVLDDLPPILCELKRARAAALLVDARRLQRAGQIDEAQRVAREVMELDPASRAARELHAGLRSEQQRRQAQERLHTLFREADEEAVARRFARAVEILNAALQLDSSSAEAAQRLEGMCTRLERSQNAAQLLMEARQSLAEENPEEARAKAAEARALDPDRPEANELLKAITETIEHRRKEAARQFRLQSELAEARSLLAVGRSAEAAAKLTPLAAEFASDASLSELLEQARNAVKRSDTIANVRVICDSLRQQGQFQRALEITDAALGDYPGDAKLLALRQEIEGQYNSARVAASIRQALDEAQWLLDQDRPHLAARFLREKRAELPQHPEIEERLQAIERMIPEWENRRFVQDCLGRAAAMEQTEQWAVALTLIEQALETSPASPELLETAKLDVEAWTEALSLIEAAQAEFPGDSDLEQRLEQARAGRRRSELDAIAAEARQYLIDREPEKAAEVLRKGMKSLPGEPALQSLWAEMEADKRYGEQCRAAQLLFGRRQFREAEEILAPLAADRRPEAQALLEAVRTSRAASEEYDFYDHAREQALKLIVQRQFGQAADLIRNLLNLFPGDAVLERDLQMAEAGEQAAPPPAPAMEAPSEPAPDLTPKLTPEPTPVPSPPPTPEPAFIHTAPRMETLSRPGILPYVLWPALGASVLVFVTTSGSTIWSMFHRQAEAAAQAPAPPVPPRIAVNSNPAPAPAVEPPKSQEPIPISQPAPVMPAAAVQRGIRGPVTLEITVSPKGTIMQVKTLSGNPILAEAAKLAVWRWRYEPGRRNGHPAAVKLQVQLFDGPEGAR
jgi:TonB family protein